MPDGDLDEALFLINHNDPHPVSQDDDPFGATWLAHNPHTNKVVVLVTEYALNGIRRFKQNYPEAERLRARDIPEPLHEWNVLVFQDVAKRERRPFERYRDQNRKERMRAARKLEAQIVTEEEDAIRIGRNITRR